MKYIKALDGVRALAILLVMLFHFYFLVEVGWIGVQLFFVLSGYLITTILLESKTDHLGGYLKRFYWRRSLRIFPLYYLYLAGVTLLYIAAHVPADFLTKIPYLAFYNYNHYPIFESLSHDVTFTHFWSLSVEEQFYLFWPFIVFFLNGRQLKALIVFLILGVPLFRYLIYDWLVANQYPMSDLGQIIYRLTPAQIDGFAFGAAIPVFRLYERTTESKYLFWVVLAVFLGLGALNYTSLDIPISSLGYPNGEVRNYQFVWSYSLIDLLSLGLILMIISTESTSLLKNFFANNIMVQIGKVSYGMYVYHWTFLAGYRKIIHPYIGYRPLSFIVYLALVYLISWLSFRFFESFFIGLKERDSAKPIKTS
jgi:peptidoglycan/LPS O-acetylase OafA/YrhL